MVQDSVTFGCVSIEKWTTFHEASIQLLYTSNAFAKINVCKYYACFVKWSHYLHQYARIHRPSNSLSLTESTFLARNQLTLIIAHPVLSMFMLLLVFVIVYLWSLWVEVNLCRFYLWFVYISKAFGDSIIKKWRVPSIFFVSVLIQDMDFHWHIICHDLCVFNDWRWEVVVRFVDILWNCIFDRPSLLKFSFYSFCLLVTIIKMYSSVA